MKKILILSIIMLLNAAIYAQTVNITQGGWDTVKIFQSGDNLINIENNLGTTVIKQYGSANRADVIYPGPMYSVTGNYVGILQYGNGNYSRVWRSPMEGFDMYAYIEQIGDYNYVDLTQPDTYSPGLSTSASIVQRGSYNEVEAYQERGDILEIEQIGNYNNIESHQENTNFSMYSARESDGYIKQQGDYNQAVLKQYNSPNSSEIVQKGNHNFAQQSQGSGSRSGYSTVKITQEQDNAYAYQTQHNPEGNGNYAEIYQRALGTGESNYTEQIQSGCGNRALAHTYHGDNHIVQVQNSIYSIDQGDNWSYVKQGGHHNNTEVTQYGTHNAAFVETYGAWSDYNNIIVTQGDHIYYADILGDHDYASVYISGAYNTANIEQTGYYNQAGADPYWDKYGIEILGNNNTAEIIQSGNYNYADIKLNGNNMETRINQSADYSYVSITQEN